MSTRGLPTRGVGPLPDLLRELGMTQRELAARSGVSREMICCLCVGRLQQERVRPATVAALAWALEVPIESLASYLAAGTSTPLGPRGTGAPYESANEDWVIDYRRGRDPFIERQRYGVAVAPLAGVAE